MARGGCLTREFKEFKEFKGGEPLLDCKPKRLAYATAFIERVLTAALLVLLERLLCCETAKFPAKLRKVDCGKEPGWSTSNETPRAILCCLVKSFGKAGER